MNLSIFLDKNLFNAGTSFFKQLNIPLNSNTTTPLHLKDILKDKFKSQEIFENVSATYFLGLVDKSVFDNNLSLFDDGNVTFDQAVEKIHADYEGMMIFAVQIDGIDSATRTQLSDLTRAFNRASKSLPVVVLFQYNDFLTLATSERITYKQPWREGEKIGKISLLKDIDILNPHTGHIKILIDLVLKPGVRDFNGLYQQWREVFDVQLLNRNFYKELSAWYFWAVENAEFPDDAEKNREIRNALSIIRLLTRLIFVWFVKEKGLIPDKLFDRSKLDNILNYKDSNDSSFYKAILQNLFFATLNQEQNKRPFRRNGQNYNVTNLYRYKKLFKIDEIKILDLFKNIPFLNGGLFECLDKPHSTRKGPHGGDIIIRIDGFSDRDDNVLKVPDYLFFDEERNIDLNEVFGTKNKKYKVKGLINLLNKYKFTIAENTPIEEEIALDPELLGKVFENLLASYNPETKTTARKQTGSFYTPREIVDYMVDESLKASLSNLVSKKIDNATEEDIQTGLEILFAYTEEEHAFTKTEVSKIIEAVSELKILDPACGSGAFPMGILHKLVFILSKLDEDNKIWRKLQKQRALKETEAAYNLGNNDERHQRLAEIERAFDFNTSDYGRKLFLIENSIYGVDIQPIAVQIAKLRFFISLIVDQDVDKTKENLGILPLPNLETKFVAANTLIGVDKPDQGDFADLKTKDLENELLIIRHKHFNAKTQKTKRKYREKDKRIRHEISQVLKDSGWPSDTAEMLADWDPYDQNQFARFFDMEWMFGIRDGFDIVIGNPPWGQKAVKFTNEEKRYFKKRYPASTRGILDMFRLFIEKSIMLTNPNGSFSNVLPDIILLKNYDSTRKFMLENLTLTRIDHWGMAFENVNIDSCTIIGIKRPFKHSDIINATIHEKNKTIYNKIPQTQFMKIDGYKFNLHLDHDTFAIIEKLNNYGSFGDFFEPHEGIHSGNIREKLFIAKKIDEYSKRLIFGRNEIKRYQLNWNGKWVNYQKAIINKKSGEYAGLGKPEYFDNDKIVVRRTGDFILAALDCEGYYFSNNVFVCLPKKESEINIKYALAILNSKIATWFYRVIQPRKGKLFAELKINVLKQIPFKNVIIEKQKPIINLAEKILAQKKYSPEAVTSDLEAEIDQLVYELYDLTENEIAIVEDCK